MNAEVADKKPEVVEKAEHPLAKFKGQLEAKRPEFAAQLPAHIPAERFIRAIQAAVSRDAALLAADRISLFLAAMQAANDGLICDGREAALVIFNAKVKVKDDKGVERDKWIQKVQYMPMVAGILKKIRNSGQLSTIVAKVTYGGDKFRNWIDDNGEHIEHEAAEDQDRNIVRNVFAMAKLKDGAIEVEVLKPADIEKIRSVSRSKDRGPWVDWWDQMAIKSAIRRLSKRLPISTDLDDLIRRDDVLYDLDGAREEGKATGGAKLSLAGKFDLLAGGDASSPQPETPDTIDNDTGEVIENNAKVDSGAHASSDTPPSDQSGDKASQGTVVDVPSSQTSQPDPVLSPDAPKATKASALHAAGEAVAKKGGMKALREWIKGLDSDLIAIKTPAMQLVWEAACRKAAETDNGGAAL
jgi:recombination protein RecT